VTLFVVTHPESDATGSEDRFFVQIAGRLIPVTASAVDRLASLRERETTAASPPNANGASN
jgi:hypothetical protein